MRITLVSPYDLGVPGGVQSHVLHLASALRDCGDEVSLVAPGKSTASHDAYAATGASVKVPFNGSVAPIGLAPTSATRTRRHLAAIAPDVIHVHEPLVPVVGIAAATARSAPVVGTFHAWSASHRAYRLVRPLGRRVLAGLAGAIAVSPAAAGYHARALGVPVTRFDIVPNGVDVARFARVPPEDPAHGGADPATLLFVGRLEPRKGLAPLLRAVVLLHERGRDVRLLVVGEGPERSRCQAMVPPELRHAVRFLGRVSEEELVACYADADLYVSPALGGESFGIVLLEAMAAGRAVLASDIPGYRSVVHPEDDGVLVTPGDPTALAEGIDRLLADPARRARLVTAGRRTAAAHDWPTVAAQVRERYAAALRVRRSRHPRPDL